MTEPRDPNLCPGHSGLMATLKGFCVDVKDIKKAQETARREHREDLGKVYTKLDNEVMHGFNAALKRWPASWTAILVVAGAVIGLLGGLLAAYVALQ